MYYTIEKRHLDKSCSLVNVQKVELISFFRFLTAYNKAKRVREKTGARDLKKFSKQQNKSTYCNLWFRYDLVVFRPLLFGVLKTLEQPKLVSFINNKGAARLLLT